MERESFENPDIARIMNEHFVNVKVDREERPDLDQIYMDAVQAMTGHGGWPMSVFLTPDLKPFYGGTYFPPADSRGMPGFPRVLLSVHRAWEERRDEIQQSAAEMTDQLHEMAAVARGGSVDALVVDHLDRASQALLDDVRPAVRRLRLGAEVPAPDGPPRPAPPARRGPATRRPVHMAVHTLDKMARGGIYDHLGGGFARYSTDDRWLVPHFEKMLYDNALAGLDLPRSVPAHRRSRLRPGRPRDARLRPRPDDRPRRGLLLDRGRRQRGGGGEVLRLDAGRGPVAFSARSEARRSPTSTT